MPFEYQNFYCSYLNYLAFSIAKPKPKKIIISYNVNLNCINFTVIKFQRKIFNSISRIVTGS